MGIQVRSGVTQNQGGTELYIEINAATGTYDATTNPGGFGAPNPVRNALAMIFYGNNAKVAGDVLVLPDAHNPTSVASFTIQITDANNGILKYFVFPLPIYDGVLSYADGAIVYDQVDAAAPFIKERVSGAWIPRTAVDLVFKSISGRLEDVAFFFPRSIEFKQELNADRVRLYRKVVAEQETDFDYQMAKSRYDFVDGLLEMASNAFCAGAYNEAQTRLEEVETLQDTISQANG